MLFVCPPKFCISIVSLRTYNGPKTEKQCLRKILGGQTKSIMVFFEVANEDVIFTAMNMYKYKERLRLCKRWPCSTYISTELTMKG